MSVISDFIAARTPPEIYQAYLRPLFGHWANVLLAQAPPSGAVLDLASGTGIVTRAIAAMPDVDHVTGLDLAPPMVEVAQRLTTSANASFKIGSAQDMPFESDVFDCAYCQQGFQFFPDKVAALGEVRRVLKPGAPLTFAVWTFATDDNPVFEAFEGIVAETFGEDLVPFGPFSYGDGDALHAVAIEAGCQSVTVERQTELVTLPGARELVLFDLIFLGRPGPDGELQPLIDPEDASQDGKVLGLIERLEAATQDFAQPDGTLRAHIASNILKATA